MKKNIFGTIALILLLITSCKKNNAPPNYWTFNGVTYPVFRCLNVGEGFAVVSSNPGGNLSVNFSGPIVPQIAGTYTVVDSGAIGPNQVGVMFDYAIGTGYRSTGGNGTNQTITVSVLSSGMVTMTGRNIVLKNEVSPYDSATMNINITQTQ